jgi:hypothetical protein
MKLIPNLPCGVRARIDGAIVVGMRDIANHLAIRGETRLPMNVRPEADAEYMSEKGISLNRVLNAWPVGTCSRCQGTIINAPFVKANMAGKAGPAYCSSVCRDGIKGERRASKEAEREIDRTRAKWDKIAARRAVKTGNLPTGWTWCAYNSCHAPFRPGRATTIHCSPRCKRRWEQNQQNDQIAA